MGGRFTLSDDSHGPHRVGEHYTRVRDYLRRIGVHTLWYLTRDKPSEDVVPFERGLYATRVEGDWWEHAFWKRLRASGA